MRKRTVIGITGGFASGKTTVADMFAEKGALKIDADRISHELTKENAAIRKKIIKLFGQDIFTAREIDRAKLADIVFSDKKKLDGLSAILHPAIIRRIKKQIAGARRECIVIDAPLLIESGFNDFVDLVVVVWAGKKTQIKRARDLGFTGKRAGAIIASQMALNEKVKLADYVIDNEGDLNKTKKGVNRIWKNLQKRNFKKAKSWI